MTDKKKFLDTLSAIALLACAVAALVWAMSGCVATPGDLERIAAKQEQGEQRITAKLAEFQAGLASAQEVTETVKDAWGDTAREIRSTAEDAKERGAGMLEQMLAIALATTGAGGVGLNIYRNRTRAKALEEA